MRYEVPLSDTLDTTKPLIPIEKYRNRNVPIFDVEEFKKRIKEERERNFEEIEREDEGRGEDLERDDDNKSEIYNQILGEKYLPHG